MKRRHVHFGFLAIASSSLCFMILQAWHLYEARQINDAVNSISGATVTSAVASGAVSRLVRESDDFRIQLRWASALSQVGEAAEAERLLGILTREAEADDVRVVAQYNLANHYLRQAISADVEANAVMPLVELAKQRYRDALKQSPGHWRARYNLEQALRIAPEGGERGSTDRGNPIKRVDVIVPDFERGDLP